MRIAILPAGGAGTRMQGYSNTPKQLLSLRDGLVIDYALEAVRTCQAWPHLIISSGDERIARYLVSKGPWSSFSYALPNILQSIYVLRKAFESSAILYIMPDTIFKPFSVCEDMMLRLDFPIVVGVFETMTPQKLGICELSESGEIVRLVDKPISWSRDEFHTEKPVAWGILAWRDQFWEAISKTQGSNMTEALQTALQMLGPLPVVWLEDYLDVGTPEDYERAQKEGW